jgi:hypothetical protein
MICFQLNNADASQAQRYRINNSLLVMDEDKVSRPSGRNVYLLQVQPHLNKDPSAAVSHKPRVKWS